MEKEVILVHQRMEMNITIKNPVQVFEFGLILIITLRQNYVLI